MKKLTLLSLVLVLTLAMWSCSDDSSPSGPDPDPNPGEEASAEKQFVWNAMNYWYFWQGDVAELADSFNDDDAEFQRYLKDYSDTEALFEDLQYKDDRFSFFIDDYEEFKDQQDGVYAALGFNYGFFWKTSQQQELIGYVRYVIPGTPADDAGLKRLNLFTRVDGTTLTGNNYLGLLTDNSAHDLTLAHIDTTNGTLSFPEDSTVSIASRQVTEDPVYETQIIDTLGTKIGYLMYNAFQGNSHQRLNEVFGDFKSEGIEQLVLDLRYNGGGSVLTSQVLSSLISGLGSSDQFAEFTYNSKRSQQGESVYFLDEVPIQNEDGDFTNDQGEFIQTEPINNLSLNKLYVLVSSATASASEALINGLRPYINVTLIGTQTTGKDEGSLTLYDAPAPYTDDDKANEEHKKAIQPIVLKFINSDGETYPYEFTNEEGATINAFKPDGDNNVSEITVENLQNKPDIGDPEEEPLLAHAIALITGQPTKRKAVRTSALMNEMEIQADINKLRPHGKIMYVEPFMMPKAKEK